MTPKEEVLSHHILVDFLPTDRLHSMCGFKCEEFFGRAPTQFDRIIGPEIPQHFRPTICETINRRPRPNDEKVRQSGDRSVRFVTSQKGGYVISYQPLPNFRQMELKFVGVSAFPTEDDGTLAVLRWFSDVHQSFTSITERVERFLSALYQFRYMALQAHAFQLPEQGHDRLFVVESWLAEGVGGCAGIVGFHPENGIVALR